MNNQKAGAFYSPDLTRFVCWAPLKNKLELIIESPDRAELPMKKDENGYWEISLKADPGTRYRFRPDGAGPFPDPASLSQPDGVHGSSAVTDRNLFMWKDSGWKGIPLAEMIICEIHTGTFTDKHDFEGIRSRLDYLVNVGFNTIELMPVAQFPGQRNWGYDAVFPFAVQESYGGAGELKNLVNEAHDKGIAVILDVVYNHLGPDGNYLSAFAPYFTNKYKTFWGESLNFDDAYSDGVKNYFIQNASMWLEEFHIDGLRLDAVHALKDLGSDHFVKQLKEEALSVEKRTGRRKLLIGEIDLNDIRYIQEPGKGGYGLDGQWIDEFHHALHSLLTGEKSGYYEDFGETAHLVKAFNNTYVYDGNYSTHRKRKFGSDARSFPYDRFVVFDQNHDQTGNRLKGERLSTMVSFEALKLAAATVLLSPYTPLLFMGEEYGEKNPFLFFVDHSSEELLEIVRNGRKEEFAYFNDAGDFPDPASEDSFLRSVLSWNYAGSQSDALMRWYQYLISFRKSRKAMQGRERMQVKAYTSAGKLILLERKFEQDHLVIVLNYADDCRNMVSDFGKRLTKIQDSGHLQWAGSGRVAEPVWEPGQNLEIPGITVCIYEFNDD
ncbi:MAG: malto-oligosyltrehalose trehalohydrolase [Bacteroidota bacterium]|nr:malto-oligosyltrehalose trehalohydrolase [Bacteroidota bacterium]